MRLGSPLAVGLLGVLSLGAVSVIRWLARDAAPSARAEGFDRALGMQRERDARGEIGRDEFQCMRQDLS